jgi:D-alanyl-D-alanine carboxypeptidase
VPVTDAIVSEDTGVTVAFDAALNALVDLQAKVKTGLFKKLKLARLQAAYETFCAAHNRCGLPAMMTPQHASSWRRVAIAGLLAVLTIAGFDRQEAEAHTVRRDPQAVRQAADKRVVHGPNYHPPYSAIVIDDSSGQVLHDENADEPRHPASLAKIMTLYLLFEQLDAGRLKLDTPLRVSAFAALQPPTKLGLKANQTLVVEDAIKGLVTESANDAAVVVSEAVAGSEVEFAKLMTQKARALGMMNTTYLNASGLPAEEQITTARDQALLGRAIQARFPSYYRYFSTPSFRYHGLEMHNHNALLGQVEGLDGVKTGYTEASGYNLVASVRRKEKHIIAVVLGGTSNAMRNARVRDLITRYIPLAAAGRKQITVGEPRFEQELQPSDASLGNL